MCDQESAAEDECMWIKTDRTGWEHVCVRECVCLDHYGKITGPLLSVSGFWAPTGDPAWLCVCLCVWACTCVCLYMYASVLVCVQVARTWQKHVFERVNVWTQMYVCVWDLIASFMPLGFFGGSLFLLESKVLWQIVKPFWLIDLFDSGLYKYNWLTIR